VLLRDVLQWALAGPLSNLLPLTEQLSSMSHQTFRTRPTSRDQVTTHTYSVKSLSCLIANVLADMLGFKLDASRREDLGKTTRPIYLDFQVCFRLLRTNFCFVFQLRQGNNARRSTSTGCYASVLDGPIWESSQPYTRLRLGGRKSGRKRSAGTRFFLP
jgi:hypothetical protein